MPEPSLIDQEDTEEQASRRTLDPELRAMSAVIRTLEPLDDAARSRVMVYLALRFRCTFKVTDKSDPCE